MYNMVTIVNIAVCYIAKSLREYILRVLNIRRNFFFLNLAKKVKDLYVENYKTLIKEIE